MKQRWLSLHRVEDTADSYHRMMKQRWLSLHRVEGRGDSYHWMSYPAVVIAVQGWSLLSAEVKYKADIISTVYGGPSDVTVSGVTVV